MQTAIQAMDSVLEKQMNEGGDTGVIMPILDTSQESSGLMAFYPSVRLDAHPTYTHTHHPLYTTPVL